MNIVIFSHPVLICLFAVSLILMMVDIFVKSKINWLFKIIYGLLFTAAITLSVLFGVPYQELIIITLIFVNIALFYFYSIRKENKAE